MFLVRETECRFKIRTHLRQHGFLNIYFLIYWVSWFPETRFAEIRFPTVRYGFLKMRFPKDKFS